MKHKLPAAYRDFLEDYREICEKHKLMVLSDGEPVEIGPYDPALWDIEGNTADKLRLRRTNGDDPSR